MTTSLETTFWKRVSVRGLDVCWPWLGHINHNGYGQITRAGKTYRAHRLGYELSIGPIPKGLELDHLCRMRACVNPRHLQPVTKTENILRGDSWSAKNKKKTHCPKGHALSADNLTKRLNGWRECKRCHYDRKNRRKRALAALRRALGEEK